MFFLDLFAGAGGLSCGLEMSGFKSIWSNECVPVYAETYRKNNPKTEIVIDDIQNINTHQIRKSLELKKGELDLIVGGPPCQGFSINAPIRSLDDQRNHLFKEYIKFVEEFLPKGILIENVPGIISLGKGTVVSEIYKALHSLGYSVDHKILYAAHYGIPQMRYRTFFIAIKGHNQRIEFPEPKYNANGVGNFTGSKELCIKILPLFSRKLLPHTTVWDAISDLPEIMPGEVNEEIPYNSPPQSDFQNKVRNCVGFVRNHYSSKLASINLERLKHIPQGGSWRDIPFDLLPKGLKRARRSDHTKRYGRLSPDSLCSTILTKCDPHWGSFFHPYQNRVLSVREAARIQSFPDKYVFEGNITQKYEQVGNAVPPFLAKAIGHKIKKLIRQNEE